ncbi:ATP-dependent helicase [Aquihabitans sp. McL0605]|uniref:ATP-dependent helicase n=1 Tax=Aquihabitans sp. McL0605 TaxID=3415671 RepID=UPI003CEDB0E9
MDPDRLLDGLDPSQRRAVTTESQPLAILAGAGSGKTRVLTRRIAHRCLTGTADARHVLALTFTRKAANELDTRLRQFGLRDLPAAGTFHAVAYAQLRTRWSGAGMAAPTLLDRKGRILGRILGGTTRVSPMDLAAEIEWARARLIPPERYQLAAAQADRRLPVDAERVAEWYRRYEEDKRKRGLVDFDDLLAQCADAITADPSFAAAQRWRFRHLFVDEYQDVNPLQERLLRAWLGDRPDLAVVGDPNQAIYGWNGADPSYLLDFAAQHPGAEVLELEHSYRSTPQILHTAAAVLASGRPGARHALQAHRSDGVVPAVIGYSSDLDEAHGIARAVHDNHVPGRPWSAQAVLVRTNAQTTLIEAAFRRAAIPHRVRGAGRLLDDAEVRDLLGRFDKLREPLATTLTDLEASIANQRAVLVESLGGGTADPDDPAPVIDESSAAGRKLVAFEQILRLGRDLLVVEPTARTDGFSGWLRATLQEDGAEVRNAVSIVSFHAAKGLEWPVVHLAGVEAGFVPITHARTADERAEEQRLFYVAVTRAADVLRCTWSERRTFGAQTVDRKPSPYLAWVRAAANDLATEVVHADDPLPAVAASRAVLDSTLQGERPLHDAHVLRTALQAWRTEVARQAGVRPTVVLADKALEAMVRTRPRTDDDLAGLRDIGPSTRERHGARLLAVVAECSHPTPAAPAQDHLTGT